MRWTHGTKLPDRRRQHPSFAVSEGTIAWYGKETSYFKRCLTALPIITLATVLRPRWTPWWNNNRGSTSVDRSWPACSKPGYEANDRINLQRSEGNSDSAKTIGYWTGVGIYLWINANDRLGESRLLLIDIYQRSAAKWLDFSLVTLVPVPQPRPK
jgi:hypothetical protein